MSARYDGAVDREGNETPESVSGTRTSWFMKYGLACSDFPVKKISQEMAFSAHWKLCCI